MKVSLCYTQDHRVQTGGLCTAPLQECPKGCKEDSSLAVSVAVESGLQATSEEAGAAERGLGNLGEARSEAVRAERRGRRVVCGRGFRSVRARQRQHAE